MNKQEDACKCDLSPTAAEGMVRNLLTMLRFKEKCPKDSSTSLLKPYTLLSLSKKLKIEVPEVQAILNKDGGIVNNESYMRLIRLYCQTKFFNNK